MILKGAWTIFAFVLALEVVQGSDTSSCHEDGDKHNCDAATTNTPADESTLYTGPFAETDPNSWGIFDDKNVVQHERMGCSARKRRNQSRREAAPKTFRDLRAVFVQGQQTQQTQENE